MPHHPSFHSFPWVEIGRAYPGEGVPWTVWIALIGSGDAFYRTVIVADDAVTIAIDVHCRRSAGVSPLHKSSYPIQPDTEGLRNPIQSVMDQADHAALTMLARYH